MLITVPNGFSDNLHLKTKNRFYSCKNQKEICGESNITLVPDVEVKDISEKKKNITQASH